jgi:hypothetical protein
VGDDIGKPLRFLYRTAGVSDLQYVAADAPFSISWQNLVILVKGWLRCSGGPTVAILMNQHTFALLMTMGVATGRPLMMPLPRTDGLTMCAGHWQ